MLEKGWEEANWYNPIFTLFMTQNMYFTITQWGRRGKPQVLDVDDTEVAGQTTPLGATGGDWRQRRCKLTEMESSRSRDPPQTHQCKSSISPSRVCFTSQFETFLCFCLQQAIKLEYARLVRFAQEATTPENDYRLQHIIVYFIQNQAPKKILERTLLTQFADRNLAFDERWVTSFTSTNGER